MISNICRSERAHLSCGFEHLARPVAPRFYNSCFAGEWNPIGKGVCHYIYDRAISIAAESHCCLQRFVFPHVREDIVAYPGIGEIGAFSWIVWVSALSLKITTRKPRLLSTDRLTPRLSCDCLADVCPPSHDVIVAVVVASNHRAQPFLFEFVATENITIPFHAIGRAV
jgi:hypothetical protein